VDVEEVRQFERRYPIGTKARLALALLVFTGQRRSDIVRFGKQHVALMRKADEAEYIGVRERS
jgi:integrase